MKKRLILLVVISITISLLGLVIIQIYWIRNAIAVKEAHFDRGVSEAVISTINKYNKLKIAQRALSQRDRGQHMDQLFYILDSLNQSYYNQMATQGQADPFTQNTPDQGSRGYLPSQQLRDDPVNMFFERSRIINDLFDDMFSTGKRFTISEKDDLRLIDSLLHFDLHNQGISTRFEFGIYDPVFHSVISKSEGGYSVELLQSPYVFSLFPNDAFQNPEYLVVYFPQQKQFIFSQMNAMLATSGIFILLLISSFAYTIGTIIKQKKLSVMKTDFINNMTHELKTPISTISLACQALSDKDVQKSEGLYQSYINVINEENQRLGMMTEKVLQTALIEKGKIRLNYSGIDMHDLIQDAIKKIGIQVASRGGQISTRLEATYSYLKADKVHIAAVVFNLLDNANKYSPAKPMISVSTENNSQGIIIHVQDNGIGISKANQKKIFDNLYRVSTGNIHDVKGFGLGLGYVKSIVEKHGGWVSVQSEPKRGSRFSFFLPFGFDFRKEQAKA